MRFTTAVVVFLIVAVVLFGTTSTTAFSPTQGAADFFKDRYNVVFYPSSGVYGDERPLPDAVYDAEPGPPRIAKPQRPPLGRKSDVTDGEEDAGGASSSAKSSSSSTSKATWIPMTLSNGTKYDCLMPSKGGTPVSASAGQADRRKSLAGKKLPLALTRRFNDKLKGACSSKLAGWWIYELCWDKGVRQYHLEQDKVTAEYSLGKGPSHNIDGGADGQLTYVESATYGMYLSTWYTHGTECDLDNKMRKTEIRLVCPEEDENERLGRGVGGKHESGGTSPGDHQATAPPLEVTEPETCQYVVWLRDRNVCDLPEMRKAPTAVEEISCLVVPEEDLAPSPRLLD